MSKKITLKVWRDNYKQTNKLEIYKLSSFIKNPSLFIKLAKSAYLVTNSFCKDYPKHFKWYWTKEIPRVFNGTGEVIICVINNNIVGVACLKKDNTESKLCTLFVTESFRKKHIATRLLEQSFDFLGTSKPLATIAEYKLPMFEHIIKKYNWKLTLIKNKGYYNNTSRELVYNGKLSK